MGSAPDLKDVVDPPWRSQEENGEGLVAGRIGQRKSCMYRKWRGKDM